ncbi:ABC-type multidrug transport system fused ATPase/permease subunit [Beijerinckia sp. GAS462]|nr:ABC-type multidrug transport system fused ATPase/permease subunit [Beijerinckia sp. GAS462]SEC93553.1 hypothetical protein SAMN05443249_3938 [Beijerinckia sp. 28-YEA-48]
MRVFMAVTVSVLVIMIMVVCMIMFVIVMIVVFVIMTMLVIVIVFMVVVRVIVLVAVIMMVMSVMTMAMGFRRLIGAAVGLEGRFDMGDLGAKAAHHVFQHMVAANAQAIGQHFHIHMAVTEMIGHACQLSGVAATHFGKLFRRGDDLDQTPVFEHQGIAVAQNHRLGQVEQKFGAAHAVHDDPTAMPAIIVEDDGVGGLGLPRAFVADEIRFDHVSLTSCTFKFL